MLCGKQSGKPFSDNGHVLEWKARRIRIRRIDPPSGEGDHGIGFLVDRIFGSLLPECRDW